ncbi:MAG: hypothetical protein IPL25_19065 [Saprospiraceae bacterium]|nr:hypothetical protein [Candidatus Vicinibacter affinis]
MKPLHFDDRSHDNCSIDRFEVKRMDDGVPCKTINGNQWGLMYSFAAQILERQLWSPSRVGSCRKQQYLHGGSGGSG